MRLRGSTTTKRKPCFISRPQLAGRLFRQDEQTAVDRAVDEAFEQRDLPVVLVERGTEHDAHVVLVEGVGDAGDDEREVGGVDPRHRDPDQARFARWRGRARLGSPCSRARRMTSSTAWRVLSAT